MIFPKRKKSDSSYSDEDDSNHQMKKICGQQVLEKLSESNITVKTTDKKIDDPFYSLDIFIQKYANFLKEVNEFNGLELEAEFNNLEEAKFHRIYTYSKELYTKNLSIEMKAVLEQNGIHPHPFKFEDGIQQWTFQFAKKEELIDLVKFIHKSKYFDLNYDEYIISQVFHKDFKPSKMNSDGKE
jgi:hypothetical protein